MSYVKKGILVATKHQKEQVIGPIFKKYLGCETFVTEFDTDKLGTFTGEIPRLKDAMSICKDKAVMAAQLTGHPYALASEGSFGPHPIMPFLPYAQEWMVFVDLESDITIFEEIKTSETNYQTKWIDVDSDINDFLNQVKFPSHGLCLQTSCLKTVIAKGIQNHQQLQEALKNGFELDTRLLLSTDMRAMMNPSRMNVIEKLSEQLVLRIKSLCPQCQSPGFGRAGVAGHLACQQCHMPSEFPALEVWACVQCDYQENRPRKDGKVNIDPQYCQFCNP